MPDDIPMKSEEIEGELEVGFVCYGIPIGT